ncbi:MAG: hypothetical protein V4546_16425, partial [Bacteroidota bacterium]
GGQFATESHGQFLRNIQSYNNIDILKNKMLNANSFEELKFIYNSNAPYQPQILETFHLKRATFIQSN